MLIGATFDGIRTALTSVEPSGDRYGQVVWPELRSAATADGKSLAVRSDRGRQIVGRIGAVLSETKASFGYGRSTSPSRKGSIQRARLRATREAPGNPPAGRARARGAFRDDRRSAIPGPIWAMKAFARSWHME